MNKLALIFTSQWAIYTLFVVIYKHSYAFNSSFAFSFHVELALENSRSSVIRGLAAGN